MIVYSGCNKEKYKTWPKGMYGKLVCASDGIAIIDESGKQQLTFNDTLACENPRWSPDESQIIYTLGSHSGDIHIINADGSSEKCLLQGDYQDPVWSPGGNSIVFNSGINSRTDSNLYQLNLDDGQVKKLDIISRFGHDWAPDGQRLVVSRGNDLFMFIYDINTKEYESLTHGSNPRWSPDGSKIAYQYAESINGPSNIYTIDVYSKEIKKLTQAEGGDNAVYPAWAPKGDKIAYTYVEIVNVIIGYAGWSYIYVMNQDGSNNSKLDFEYDEFMKMPDWRN
jgi:Tol biopolymer transport system component